MVYDLTEEELSALTSNSIEEHPVEKRLEILNNVIQNDYSDKVTLESLNSKERISIALHPEVEQDLAMRNRQEQDLLLPLESDNSLAPHSTEQTVLQEDEHIIREPQEGALIEGRTCHTSTKTKAGTGKENTDVRWKWKPSLYNQQKQRANTR